MSLRQLYHEVSEMELDVWRRFAARVPIGAVGDCYRSYIGSVHSYNPHCSKRSQMIRHPSEIYPGVFSDESATRKVSGLEGLRTISVKR